MTGYRLTSYNQIDDYGQDKSWKMRKQALQKRKSQIASSVEVHHLLRLLLYSLPREITPNLAYVIPFSIRMH